MNDAAASAGPPRTMHACRLDVRQLSPSDSSARRTRQVVMRLSGCLRWRHVAVRQQLGPLRAHHVVPP